MNTHDALLIVGLAFVAICARRLDADLAARGAVRWVRTAAAVSALALAGSAIGARFGADPVWRYALAATFVVWTIGFLAPAHYLRWPPARHLTVRLAEAVLDMQAAALRLMDGPDPNPDQVERVRRLVAGLDAFRDERTEEYISLLNTEMSHFLDGPAWDDFRVVQSRLAEIEAELQAEFERLGVKGRVRTLGRSL